MSRDKNEAETNRMVQEPRIIRDRENYITEVSDLDID